MTPRYREATGGIITGGFTDWHVHTALVNTEALRGGSLTRVWDLGANLADVSALAARHKRDPELPRISYAGPFLTAPGGYPSDRDWAPAGSVAELADPTEALNTVRDMVYAGARCVKVSLHSEAGPTPDDDVVMAIVREARLHGVPVVVHAEGDGEATRARELGATALAHTPFSERLSDLEVEAQAVQMTWVSTLAIHQGTPFYDTALDNLRRFNRAGGRVLYGTDMGNGPTPVGINPAEIEALREAELSTGEILAALTPAHLDSITPRVFIPGTIENLDFARAERVQA